ncbi:DUF2784 domain-containing protein [soil metagenome]
MLYRFLADSVLVVHFGFVIFVLLGCLLVLRRRRVAWLHVPAAAWGVIVQMTGWRCPLTPLENELRQRGGQAGYSGGFVEHYLLSLLYPAGLTREIQIAIGTFVLMMILTVYGTLLLASVRSASTEVSLLSVWRRLRGSAG